MKFRTHVFEEGLFRSEFVIYRTPDTAIVRRMDPKIPILYVFTYYTMSAEFNFSSAISLSSSQMTLVGATGCRFHL